MKKCFTWRFILYLLPALCLNHLSAQDGNSPYLECHYMENYIINLNRPKHIVQDEMVLSISTNGSEFYSLWCRIHAELKDSIVRKGGDYSDIAAAQAKLVYPTSSQCYTIYKDIPEKGTLTHTDDIFGHHYLMTEKLELPQWAIQHEKKTVAGYTCQRAEAAFKGRTWIAWFTPDIPASDGPWKLCGLPGLILEAQDTENHYHFTCIEINRVSGGKPIAIPKQKYIRCTQEEFLKEQTLWREDMNAYIIKEGYGEGVKMRAKDGSLVPLKLNMKFNYIER